MRNSLRHLKKPSTRWLLAGIILLGIALRLYLLFSSQVIIEADEALVGAGVADAAEGLARLAAGGGRIKLGQAGGVASVEGVEHERR